MNDARERVVIGEGKTKCILEVPGDPTAVDLEAKPDITAFDNPDFTRQIDKKPEYATMTTCRVFELLRDDGIPVAYREQVSPISFRADKCKMYSLEVVARRYAVGGYLKRHPELEQDPPFRFSDLLVEFFFKTTGGGYTDRHGVRQELNLNAEVGEEDPLIEDPHVGLWRLLHSKKPSWDEGIRLGDVQARGVIDDTHDADAKIALIKEMDLITRRVFLVLEKAWAMMGYRFIDFKIEFGLTADGRLVVADVIDNDSWRVRDECWQELSKQAFRDGESLDEVERKYGIVANLLQQFRIPEQVLAVWRGSGKDPWIVTDEYISNIPGVDLAQITLSGHKQTGKCLDMLDRLQTNYHTGVILAIIGMSNGLGPILAAHTTWPVIGMPATAEKFPDDIWSNLRLPSQTPMLVCLEKNAVSAALNILAQQNPHLYARQQLALEALDN